MSLSVKCLLEIHIMHILKKYTLLSDDYWLIPPKQGIWSYVGVLFQIFAAEFRSSCTYSSASTCTPYTTKHSFCTIILMWPNNLVSNSLMGFSEREWKIEKLGQIYLHLPFSFVFFVTLKTCKISDFWNNIYIFSNSSSVTHKKNVLFLNFF